MASSARSATSQSAVVRRIGKQRRDALVQKRQGQRGPQHRPTKTPFTVRYDPEVLAYFKDPGAGWQTRTNEVLCEWVAKRGSA